MVKGPRLAADFYVYALKDPRTSPARPFYIGKGTGVRAEDHLRADDDSLKSRRIQEIRSQGLEPIVELLVKDLTEPEALRIEAELIAAFGTIREGGCLVNQVVPSGRIVRGRRRQLVVPLGVRDKAQIGLQLLKDAVLELARANPEGVTNADCASVLGLRSDYKGGSKDYLSFSILGLLIREGRLERIPGSRRHRATSIRASTERMERDVGDGAKNV